LKKDKKATTKRRYTEYIEALQNFARTPEAGSPRLEDGNADEQSASQDASESVREENIRKRIEDITHRIEITTGLREDFGNTFLAQLKTKEQLKKTFFKITMGMLVVALLFVGGIISKITKQPLNGNGEAIAAFITAVVGGVTALLALPKIIADYLFNKEEHVAITSLLSEMIKKDSTEEENKI